jgi:D-beta-D-heptose 7-phosphate kinase/D-beta-D-heptose 1-phosphate adenosyltransferase
MQSNTPKILVIGDVILDHYLWGEVNRISPEAPVQIVDIKSESLVLGGAGNVVNNLYTLNSKVAFLSVIGKDKAGLEIKKILKNMSVKRYLVEQKKRKTSKKSRIIASHSQVIRYDKESKEDISKKSAKSIFKEFKLIYKDYDIILLSDYGKGVLTPKLTQKIIKYANQKDKKVLIDPKGDNYSKYNGAYLLTPNKKEAILASKIEIKDKRSLTKALKKLKKRASLSVSLITLSEDGIAFYDDKLHIKPTVAKEVYDVTGAGDTVLASLGYAFAKDMDISSAIEFANLSAGVVVGKLGSATASIEEIQDYKSSLHKSSIQSHIKSFNEIKDAITRLKKQNKKIVFTNGCFDILHRGHVSYLDIAKSYGDILILGLNSDSSVKRLKGKNRPINCEDDRAYILAGLESVDFVIKFEDDTPYELIEMIKPDILVKGGDYQGKEVVGSDIAGEVRLVDFVDGKSTTKTIKKIQRDKNDK